MIYVAVSSEPHPGTTQYGWVEVINGTSDSVVSEVKLANPPGGIAANPNTDRIYVIEGSSMDVIDGASSSIVATIPVSCEDFVAVNPNTDEVYVSNTNGNSVCVINGTTDTQTDSIGVALKPNGIGVNTATNKIYVASEGGSQGLQSSVAIINGSTNSVIKTIPSSGYDESVAVNQATNKVYVTNAGTDLTYVIDGSSDNATQTSLPFSCVGANPATNEIYACDENNPGQIDIVNGTSDSMISTIQTNAQPSYLTVNPETNKTYVSAGPVYPGSVIVMQGGSANTTVTSTPQNLQATAGNAQVSLSWSAPSSNGGSPITNYKLYKSTSSGSELLFATFGNMTSYIDTTVTNGQAYFYKVTAVNSIGESTQSNEANATPMAPATAPSEPTGLAASVVSSSQINLSWTAPSSNGGSVITGYEIQRSNDGGNTWSAIVSNTGSTATSYSDTGLSPKTTYMLIKYLQSMQ